MGQELRSYPDMVKRRKADEFQMVARPVDPAYEITALVALDGSPCSFTAATLVLDRARRFDAHLLGFGVVDEASIRRPESVPLGAGVGQKAQHEARAADIHHRVAGFLADFRARAATIGVRSDALEKQGDPPSGFSSGLSVPTS